VIWGQWFCWSEVIAISKISDFGDLRSPICGSGIIDLVISDHWFQWSRSQKSDLRSWFIWSLDLRSSKSEILLISDHWNQWFYWSQIIEVRQSTYWIENLRSLKSADLRSAKSGDFSDPRSARSRPGWSGITLIWDHEFLIQISKISDPTDLRSAKSDLKSQILRSWSQITKITEITRSRHKISQIRWF